MRSLQLLAWGVIVVQGAHVFEHVAQAAQVFVLGVPRPQAHGIVGELFDLEWLHLAYNTMFLLGLAWALRLRRSLLREPNRGVSWSMFVAGLTLQAYHELEHVVKIYQHVALDRNPAPGILGSLGDLVVLHLMFNLAVYSLVLPLLRNAIATPVGQARIELPGREPADAREA